MATTSLADVWEPAHWVDGTQEKMNTFPHLLNSPAVFESDRLADFASGSGNTITLPFWSDITDQDDAIQVESTDITTQKHTTGLPVATVLEREYGYSASALSAQRSGGDPVGAMMATLAQGRAKRQQKALLSQVRGIYDTALADNSNDSFVEIVGSQTADHLIDADMVLEGNALLSEMLLSSDQATMWMHPDIMVALRKQDEHAFSAISMQGGLTIAAYKGMPIYLSSALSRAGTTSGVVYETYVFGGGMIGKGAKAQVGDKIDVASLQYDPNFSKNDEGVYDRNRYAMHVDGFAWGGSPAGTSATNAELAVGASWSLKYASADRVRMFRIRSNG